MRGTGARRSARPRPGCRTRRRRARCKILHGAVKMRLSAPRPLRGQRCRWNTQGARPAAGRRPRRPISARPARRSGAPAPRCAGAGPAAPCGTCPRRSTARPPAPCRTSRAAPRQCARAPRSAPRRSPRPCALGSSLEYSPSRRRIHWPPKPLPAQCTGKLCAFAARRGAHVQHALAGLHAQKGRRRGGACLLHIIGARMVQRASARAHSPVQKVKAVCTEGRAAHRRAQKLQKARLAAPQGVARQRAAHFALRAVHLVIARAQQRALTKKMAA